jgi:diaminohydroxyphosphoribosylaminopyrimidine deaminase/5-amino-6-(5-phosphoribosylamino)uracil reductase
VSLEPCSYFGRTPPCADALIDVGVIHVVAAMTDPNPKVAGAGLARLQAAGIVVRVGLLESAARELNPGFITRMTRQRPFVRIKLAASIDGRTALAGGESQWITGPDARRDTHRWRARACAVLTGSGTVLADNPQLNVRDVGGFAEVVRQPLRVLVDSTGRVSPLARVFFGPALWVTSLEVARSPSLPDSVEQMVLPSGHGHVDLPALLGDLARRGVNELHVEAGPKLSGALIAAGLADELLLYLAPCVIGDTGRGLFSMPGLESLADRPQMQIRDVRMIGNDLLVMARLN